MSFSRLVFSELQESTRRLYYSPSHPLYLTYFTKTPHVKKSHFFLFLIFPLQLPWKPKMAILRPLENHNYHEKLGSKLTYGGKNSFQPQIFHLIPDSSIVGIISLKKSGFGPFFPLAYIKIFFLNKSLTKHQWKFSWTPTLKPENLTFRVSIIW